MALFDAVRSRRQQNRREASEKVAQEIQNRLIISPICSDYENLFAQVRPLINEMKLVRPFGVNEKGEKIKSKQKTPELNLLDYPNREMGWAEFADLMFATWLTKDQLFIHVHFDEKRRNVIGYSVLPSSTFTWNGNNYIWQTQDEDGNIITLTSADVMTLRFSRSPDDPFRGVSPATASRAWAQTDDIVAQYQRAYFENGAIPATITFITASTREKYEQTRFELESKLKGAKNRNKTVYAWRQYLPGENQTMDEIEVKTIQAPNNTLAIDEIVKVINDRLNKAVGVSNFIMGDDSSAKYDNAELSQQQFIRNRVYPALITFWSQFQFELDRITGGLGYAIQFEIEIPELTERAKVKAETAEKNTDTIIKLIQAGADPTSTVKALELSPAWLKVAAGIYTKALAAETTQNSTQAPLASADSFTHAHDCQCIHDAIELTTEEQKIYDVLLDMANAIMRNDPGLSQEDVIQRIAELLEAEGKKGHKKAIQRMLQLIETPEIREELEKELKNITLNAAITDRIRARATLIVGNYDKEVRDQMRAVLENTRALTAAEIEQKLTEAIPRARARMIARTETTYAFKSVQIDDYLETEKRWGVKIQLTWKCQPDTATCDVCAAMDGKTTTVGKAFEHLLEFTEDTELPNGKTLDAGTIVEWLPSEWNDQGKIPQPHPNCRCYFEANLERQS
jgi:phage portal protein BeeE